MFLIKRKECFFDNYQLYENLTILPSLLWEYKMDNFDWKTMQNIVVQRVVERGRLEDFYAALNLYGLETFIEEIKNIPEMNKKDINFVSKVFNVKKNELKCYTKKQCA
jgi:hypothetical protein